MTNHAVVIAGAGPTGLMLAGELALAQVDGLERRANQDQPRLQKTVRRPTPAGHIATSRTDVNLDS